MLKKIKIASALIIVFALLHLLNTVAFALAEQDISGSGTQSDPYLIYNAADWDSIGIIGSTSSYWALANDINMKSLGESWKVGFDWSDRKFDGGGYHIDSLKLDIEINDTSNTKIGLLVNEGDNGEFKNVTIKNADITVSSAPAKNNGFLLISGNLSTMSIDSVTVIATVFKIDTLALSKKSNNLIEESKELPDEFSLSQNYPNPFNPSTTIGFSIKEAGSYSIRIYNMLGQLVEVLGQREYTPGSYKIIWNAGGLSSGIYFYHLGGENVSITKKLLLMK